MLHRISDELHDPCVRPACCHPRPGRLGRFQQRLGEDRVELWSHVKRESVTGHLQSERDQSIAGMYIQREIYQSPACINRERSINRRPPIQSSGASEGSTLSQTSPALRAAVGRAFDGRSVSAGNTYSSAFSLQNSSFSMQSSFFTTNFTSVLKASLRLLSLQIYYKIIICLV